MALNLEVKKNASTITDTISSGDGIARDEIREYNLDFSLKRVTSGTYPMEDLRLRIFPYHHFSTLSNPSNEFYQLVQVTPLTYPLGGVVFNADVEDYEIWRNKVRPPRIDEDTYEGVSMNFSSEGVIKFNTTNDLDATYPSATNGTIGMYGIFGNKKLGRYQDIQKSFSYIDDSSYIVGPTNMLVELRDNAKTKSISSLTGIDNGDYTGTITVTTSTAHGYGSIGQTIGVTITGATKPVGIKYNGLHKATITGTNTFTYDIYVPTGSTLSSSSTGSVEIWYAVDQELTISSISGNGSGTITANIGNSPDTNLHGIRVGDVVNITGTTSYDGTDFEVTAITPTSITYVDAGNTATASETGAVEFCARAPSDAVSVNYPSGITPAQSLDHTEFTKLVYANKDTTIGLQAGTFDIGTIYATGTFIPNGTDSGFLYKTLFNFPIGDMTGLTGPFISEIGAFVDSGSYTADTQLNVYQMTSNTWNETTINYTTGTPLINALDTISTYYYDNYTVAALNAEEKAYMKFDVPSSRIQDWIDGTSVASVAIVADLESPEISADIYFVTKDNTTSVWNEQAPYLVVSGNPSSDDTAPTLEITDTTMYISVTSIQGTTIGGGTDYVTVNTIAPHGLTTGDYINVIGTVNYLNINVQVTVTGPNSFTYEDEGASTTPESNIGLVQRVDIIDVDAQATDNLEIADGTDSNDIVIRKGAALTDIVENSYTKSPDTVLTFNFTLDELDDGFFDVKVRDAAGNYSSLPFEPPLIMEYFVGSEQSGVITAGDIGYINGFNIDNFSSSLSLTVADDAEYGGVFSGGYTQTISVGALDTANNRFSFTYPSNTQPEWEVGTIDTVSDTIEIIGIELAATDIIIFNSLGNNMVDPLKVGEPYIVESLISYDSGTQTSTIRVTQNTGGGHINLISTVGVDMVAYTYLSPLYVTKDGFNASDYNNILYARVDDHGPFIDIPTIIGTGTTINVTITDVYPIDQSSISFINGSQTATPIVDVNGDGRVLIYEVDITGAGSFEVNISDINGNNSTASETVPPIDTPFIQVTGYDFSDPLYEVILSVSVTDDNMPSGATDADFQAANNTDQGIYVESSIANNPYAITENFAVTGTGITFDIKVSSIGDGIMTIYARDVDDNNNSITPPVIISVSPECIQSGDELIITGINLDQSDTKYFFGKDITIDETETSNVSLSCTVNSGSDGIYDIILVETISGVDYISNTVSILFDETPPIMTLVGDTVVDVIQGQPYIELGATATDIISGDVTSSITETGSVDTNTLGTYILTYTAYDDCGNESSLQRSVNVVTGCPINISVSPNEVDVGDIVTITATLGLFNPIPYNNTVTFNGVVGQVLSGSRTELSVIVPVGATTGPVQVETGADNTDYEACSLSNIDTITVIYPDDDFPVDEDIRGDIVSKSGNVSIFGKNISSNAIYNRDLSYSYFAEVTDENSMIQNVYSIILTRVGERLFKPEFGTRLEDLIHSIVPNTPEFEKEILKEISNAVAKYEPRVTIVENESFVIFTEGTNSVSVVLKMLVPNGNVETLGLTFKSIRNSQYS